jgi:hypothetical protein
MLGTRSSCARVEGESWNVTLSVRVRRERETEMGANGTEITVTFFFLQSGFIFSIIVYTGSYQESPKARIKQYANLGATYSHKSPLIKAINMPNCFNRLQAPSKTPVSQPFSRQERHRTLIVVLVSPRPINRVPKESPKLLP